MHEKEGNKSIPPQEHRDSIVVSDDPKKLLDRLASIKQLSVDKWVDDIKVEETK